ncbi:hypothetical protein B0H34DRAFT_761794 [Crassisporium funariophilum]|nr:hypothetical protein B0H34DRAFT_761794 [Crassisporium funariophilum]
MPGRSFSPSIFLPVAHSIKRRTGQSLVKTARRSSTLTIPPYDADTHTSFSTPASTSNPVNYARKTRFNDLRDALANNGSPTFIWANYTNLLNFLGNESLPLEVHQEVLRRCTPSAKELQIAAVRRLRAGNVPATPHVHEGRFQTIMRNIRSLGAQPTLEDYNFVLEQFSAVGHYVGCMQVYKELKRIGHKPNAVTFGLCFQAIAHRFTLPIWRTHRPALVNHTQEIFNHYIADMRHLNVPLTPVNLDLMLRILKETLDYQGFEALMRWGYGIDLSNPDRVALEYGDNSASQANGELPIPFPFTTNALNTTIDMLGRLGDVSKLVQAFEVLTQPLPQASQHFFNSFEEDEDFGVSVDISTPTRFPPPYAPPNTTTFNMLLRHVSRAGHAVFTRHYLLQAMTMDREADKKLRHATWRKKKPLEKIPAPHFAVNYGHLVSVLGESNTDKDLGLMRWLSTKMPYVLRKKKNDLSYFTSLREERRQLEGTSTRRPAPPRRKPELPGIFDLDLENPPPVEKPTVKYFDIDLHIQILKRNVFEIEDFAKRLEFMVGRTTQRLKERLGRRVWGAKDIYLSTEDARVRTTRDAWKGMVNFQPRKDTYEDPRKRRSRIVWKPSSSSDDRRWMSTTTYGAQKIRTCLTPPVPVQWQSFSERFSRP